ncbi:hypothetical protein DPMN_004527 [Dreissena polymorpha]|uniref:Uncharacterized protein n=1 Tax=Dreissena polymorpha TaxID=45954 RepID=A0A9D4MNP6_DREPO|nr:hypothetical protein DPMN_004527 [Dreissena polymorpha]
MTDFQTDSGELREEDVINGKGSDSGNTVDLMRSIEEQQHQMKTSNKGCYYV